MLAVTAKLTMVHYGHKHLCTTHGFKVDKNHIDQCSNLNSALQDKVTAFNEELNNERLYSWKSERLQKLHTHFSTLAETL